MIKHYCDFCGKELKHTYGNTYVKIGTSSEYCLSYEVCDKCKELVNNYIKLLRGKNET